MTAYLLDTNVCIQVLHRKHPVVTARLRSKPPSEIRLCSVVVGELFYGAFHGANPTKNLALIREFLEPFASLSYDKAAAEEL